MNKETEHLVYRGPDVLADVAEFHKKFGIAYEGKPRALPQDLLDFRHNFLREEYLEFVMNSHMALESVRNGDDEAVIRHLEESLDALVDLVYVAVGTAHLHGFDFDEAWRRVHEKNMQKIRAETAIDSKRGSIYDVVKPEGWLPPSHTDLVADHAHKEQTCPPKSISPPKQSTEPNGKRSGRGSTKDPIT